MNSFQRAFMTVIACLCFSVTAFAQTWPQRAIKVIAPYPPGGPSDIVIRTVSDKVQAALKQAVIIENIPGAGGNIGSAAAARACRWVHMAHHNRHGHDSESACLQKHGI